MNAHLNPPRPSADPLTIVYVVLLAVALLVAFFAPDAVSIITIWVVGAAALGLISGFTAGAARSNGVAVQLVTFFSSGIVVPLLGGIASLLKQPEKTTETNTYSGEQLITRITEVTAIDQPAELHPLWVAGSFFAAYSIAAMIGHRRGRNDVVRRNPPP